MSNDMSNEWLADDHEALIAETREIFTYAFREALHQVNRARVALDTLRNLYDVEAAEGINGADAHQALQQAALYLRAARDATTALRSNP